MNKTAAALIFILILLFQSASAALTESASDEEIRNYLERPLDKDGLENLEKLADVLFQQKRFLAASEIYQNLLSKYPSKQKTFLYNVKLGDIFAELKNYSQSLSFYNTAKNLYGKDIEIRLKIGNLLFENGLYNLAQESYLEILKINKNSDEAKIKLGDIFFLTGDFLSAAEYYEKIDRKRYDEPLIINIAKTYRKTGGADKALVFLNNYLKSSDSAEIYFLAGKFYYQKKDYQNAQINFLSALKQNNQFFEAYLYLADINIEYENNLDLADALLEKAFALKPDSAAIDLLRSCSAYKRGNNKIAENFAESAYKKSKTDFTRQEAKRAADFFNKANAVQKKRNR